MPVCPHCEREIDVPEIVEINLDQTLPRNPITQDTDMPLNVIKIDVRVASAYLRAQQDMIKAGWRKVK